MLTRLRSLTLSIVLCLMSYVCSAQWVAIPDSNFGKWLNTNGYAACLQGNSTSGWQMDTTCNAVVSATDVHCGGIQISDLTGISYFDNLHVLYCEVNNLITLPPLPADLINLYCARNSIANLPPLPLSLNSLSVHMNSLTSLPVLPTGLQYLAVGSNPSLVSLPILPNSITKLYCNNTQVQSIPNLPTSLKLFACSNSSLTSLPKLPEGLEQLYVENTLMSVLPDLPQSITTLYCGGSVLNTIPQLPDSLDVFSCVSSPNLHCLPPLHKIVGFYFYNTGIECLPNYPTSNLSCNPGLNTISLCNLFNEYGCEPYWNISGRVYEDTSENCNYDAGENTFSNWKINLYQNSALVQQTNTYHEGNYSFKTNLSTFQYSVDTANLPFSVYCPDSGFHASTVAALDSFDFDMDFGLRCKPGFDLEVRSIVGWFVPANILPVKTLAGDASNFYNAHCAAGTSGAVTVTINGSAHYTAPASGALTPTVNGNTLTYTIADFGAVNFFTDFNIIVQTDTTAVLGSQICITVSVTPTAGDNNPANNTLTICFPVVASYDPNDKTAYPAGDIDTAQKEITYTVRFQNTGTAEAQHIYITDTLDTDIDESSFRLLSYSHQPMVQIEQNRVRFNFPNINLPDSNTNEPLSHGYVQYKVKLKPNLPIGTQINNTAHIYFDFNAPVITNTTSNTITTNTAIKAVSHEPLAVRIFPNPANASFTVSVSENLKGETITVTDVTGKQMAAVQLQTINSKLETTLWASGVYFVRVGNSTQKLVVQK